ncbi:hypothetical protein BDV93DRAFT_512570 [Ceratobasidium sp. AG-I]|nr:hypothetical protein BDV93DRAFT_512570 [Ceratobasidium sp. AG-I]
MLRGRILGIRGAVAVPALALTPAHELAGFPRKLARAHSRAGMSGHVRNVRARRESQIIRAYDTPTKRFEAVALGVDGVRQRVKSGVGMTCEAGNECGLLGAHEAISKAGIQKEWE